MREQFKCSRMKKMLPKFLLTRIPEIALLLATASPRSNYACATVSGCASK